MVPFIFRKFPMTILKGKTEEFVGTFVVRIEHCLSADKIFVRYLLGQRKMIFVHGAVDGAYQRFAQIQFVDAKIDFQQLIDQIQHAQPFGVLVR